MGALDLSVVSPSIPAIEKSMLIHGDFLNRIFSGCLVFNRFAIPLVRKLSDIHDRKFLYVVSEPIFVLGSGPVSVPRDINCFINCFISNKKAPTNLIVSA